MISWLPLALSLSPPFSLSPSPSPLPPSLYLSISLPPFSLTHTINLEKKNSTKLNTRSQATAVTGFQGQAKLWKSCSHCHHSSQKETDPGKSATLQHTNFQTQEPTLSHTRSHVVICFQSCCDIIVYITQKKHLRGELSKCVSLLLGKQQKMLQSFNFSSVLGNSVLENVTLTSQAVAITFYH